MAGGKGGGVVSILWKVLIIAVVIGVFLALLRAFDSNIFAVFDWLLSWAVSIVNGIADFLTGRAEFQQIVRAPA